MTSPYDLFRTDHSAETDGIVLDYGAFEIKIARAGGANRKYLKGYADVLEKYGRQIEAGALDEKTEREIMIGLVADHVILDWSGVADAEGSTLPFTRENVVKLLSDLPELYLDIRSQAHKIANFRAKRLEDKVGNSPAPSAGSSSGATAKAS